MPGSQKICLTKQILHPISLFSGYGASGYIQTEKLGCYASTDTFKNCFKKFSVTFVLHAPDLPLHKKQLQEQSLSLVLGSTGEKTDSCSFNSILATVQTQKDCTCCEKKNWQHSKKEKLFEKCYLGPDSHVLLLRLTTYFWLHVFLPGY